MTGDIEGKEYSTGELKKMGAQENVVKAYTLTREAINQTYEMLNNARKQIRTKQANMSEAQLKELRKNKFAEILKVDKTGDDNYIVAYREPKVWVKHYPKVDASFLSELKKDPNTQIMDENKNADGTYDVTYRQTVGDIHKLGGYIPHFFHDFFILKDVDGEKTVVGSGRTVKDAISKAEDYLKDNPQDKILISPKGFSFEGDDERLRAAVIGDEEFKQVTDKVMKDLEMNVTEAKEFLQGKVKIKNRNRFFGNFLERKGAAGFETNMDWVLKHYFNAASRYVALEEFKPNAIGLFERYFGAYDKDYSDNPLAHFTKQYIDDINGNPSALENMVNNFLNSSNWWRKYVASSFGDRAALELANSITGKVSVMKLGFLNVSSALLNMAQLNNTIGIIGEVKPVVAGLAEAMHPSLSSTEIYAKTGIMNDITLDTSSGYGKLRPGRILGKSMYLFRTMDMLARKATVLAAYHAGINRGMTDAQAVAYAKEVNRKANFDYSVADAPNVFRRGSIFSQVALQFKKYPIKEFELMYDITKNGTAKQKTLFWGTYFLLAGLLQIPAFDWFNDVWKDMFGSSPKNKIKKMMFEAAGNNPTGNKLAEWAAYGIGGPTLGIDFSNRVGVGDISFASGDSLAEYMGGATFSTAKQLAKAIGTGDTLAGLKALSPALGNYVQAYMGHTEGTRGRTNNKLNGAYEQILKSAGFRTVDESVERDRKLIVNEEKAQYSKERQKAIDKAIGTLNDGKLLTPTEVSELKKYKVTPKAFKAERIKKSQTAKQRMLSGMNKRERYENRSLMQFGENN